MRKLFGFIGVIFLLFTLSQAQEMKPLESGDIIVVERDAEGATEKEAVEDASREAVQSCVGRVYFTDKLVMARSLLTRYIDHYYHKFVFSTLTVNKRHTGDKVYLKIKVYVDYSRLLADLEEKGFLFKPKARPLFIVFLSEILDGSPAPYSFGRDTIRSSWKDMTGQREPEAEITIPPTNMDVSESPPLFNEAIRVAQKNGAEIVLCGTSKSQREERQEFYYDTYTFYRTTISLKVMRVDDGKVMGEITVSSIAGSLRQSQAIELSITRAANKAASALAETFLAQWDNTVQNKGDYIFLFSGVTDEKLDIINKHLLSLDPNARFFLKSRYSDVAVGNFLYKGTRERLIFAIERLAYPRMHILRQEGNHWEVQIKN